MWCIIDLDISLITGTETAFPSCLYACVSLLLRMKLSGKPCNCLDSSGVSFLGGISSGSPLLFIRISAPSL